MTKPQMDKSWLPAFRYFLSLIKITSKEMREPGPITPYTAQNIFLEELEIGLEEDVHFFVCLKARQLGISTVLLALDIFWLYMNPGLQGALIADTGENRETFRTTISEMLDSLPKGFRIPIKSHNKNALQLANGSRLQYMQAGKGKNAGLGRSRGLSYVHASEISSWGDPKGLDSLIDALATENPDRMYVFESTALGYNLFWDVWKDALEDELSKRTMFIGWWAKETYKIEHGSPRFEQWWGSWPELTEYEAKVTETVSLAYGVEIGPEQWAWYRERADTREDQSMFEEMPSLPEEAFQATGSPFFNLKRVNNDLTMIHNARIAFKGYRYELGENFLKMKMLPAETLDGLDLRVWETPKPNGVYVMGVDPAFGSGEEADKTVISIWRCFSDKVVQVAEYATPIATTQHCAWVMAHLAGEYRDCMINLEITGPGGQVMMEIKHLRQSLHFGPLHEMAREMKLEHVLDSARWFLWRKPDNINGVASVFNFKTTQDSKSMGMNRLRDAYNTDQAVMRSVKLLDEMTTFVQNGDSLGASGRNKDDRVMAGMLAIYAWSEWRRTPLMSEGRSFVREMAEQDTRDQRGGSVVENLIPDFFRRQAEAREANELRRILEDGL